MARTPYIPHWHNTITSQQIVLCRMVVAEDLTCPSCDHPLTARIVPETVYDALLHRFVDRARVAIFCLSCQTELDLLSS